MQFTTIFLLFILLLNGCSIIPQADETAPFFQKPGFTFPYQLSDPDQTWILPNSLVEISGLGFADDDRLACIQDEKGVIFIFNLKSGKIEREIAFAKDGDYEGIEVVGKDAWILKSNGTLYRVTAYLETAEPLTTEFPTALTGRNNTEGLAYDPVNRNLLIACKGFPFLNAEPESKLKSVYGFNVVTGRLTGDPFLLIHPDSILRYKNYGVTSTPGNDHPINPDAGDENEPFMPSGIAIHPETRDVYLLGSVGKILMVCSSEGEMLAMVNLNRKQFPQPEGICFSPEGNLFISSEGKLQPGKIMLFKPGK